MASGAPLRAPIIRSSSPAKTKPSANAPRSFGSAALTASTGFIPLREKIIDQLHDRLGVGLGLEFCAGLFEFLAQFTEILDDAVVNDRNALGRMRMRIGFGRLAVRGPARVTDTAMTLQRLALQSRFQILQLAFGAAPLQPSALERGDACGVIAAILQPLERIDELLSNRSLPQNSDNSAHAVCVPSLDDGLLLSIQSRTALLKYYCRLRHAIKVIHLL